eukprot:g19146.t1
MKKRLKTPDTARAMGPDNDPAIVLKVCAPELATPLVKLFQYSYNTGVFPPYKVVTITEFPTITILGVIIDQEFNKTHYINTVATRAGQNLEILRRVTHLLTPQSLSTIYKA